MLSVRAALVLLVSLGVAGCGADQLTPAGARVEIDRAPREGCRLIAAARGSAGYNGRSGEENTAAVERYLKNQAAERGGNRMVITERKLGGGESGDTLSTPRGATSSGGCPNCVAMSANVYACPVAPASPPATPFPVEAAQAALAAAARSASSCAASGEARVKLTFATSGDVVYVEAEVDGVAGTPAGECVARKFRNVHLPAFTGEARSMEKSVRLAPP